MPLLLSCGQGPAGRYMLIPVKESNDEVTLTISKGGETLYVADIRLATDGDADYCVPLDLDHFGATKKNVSFSGIDAKAAWALIGFSDTPPEIPADKYRGSLLS